MNSDTIGDKPVLLGFVLRLLAPDGRLFLVDGNDSSVALYLAEYGQQGVVVRASEHPIFAVALPDEMLTTVSAMEALGGALIVRPPGQDEADVG